MARPRLCLCLDQVHYDTIGSSNAKQSMGPFAHAIMVPICGMLLNAGKRNDIPMAGGHGVISHSSSHILFKWWPFSCSKHPNPRCNRLRPSVHSNFQTSQRRESTAIADMKIQVSAHPAFNNSKSQNMRDAAMDCI
jgi:hypothetical protein